MKLPILKIAELIGGHRDTISKRLADLPFEAGKKGAKLYSSEEALAAIYKTDSLEAARAEQARTAAQLNAIRADVLRKDTNSESRKSLCCSHDVSAMSKQPWQALPSNGC